MRRDPRRDHAIDEAVRALERRDRSVAQVRERLARHGVEADAADDAVASLERAGVLDDERYAAARAAALAARGYGDAAIGWRLAEEGIAGDLVGAALSALEPEEERARAAVADASDPARAGRALSRKGFSADAVAAALSSPVADDGGAALRYDD